MLSKQQTILLNWLAFIYQHRRILLTIFLGLALTFVLILLPHRTLLSLFYGLLAQRLLISLLLLFSLVIISVLWSVGEGIDALVFRYFNLRGWKPAFMDKAMWVSTQAGNAMTGLVIAVILYFVFGLHRLAVELVLGMSTLWIVVDIFKTLTDRTRPYITLNEVRVIGVREPGCSFPSGHTSQTFFLVYLLTLHFQPHLFWLLGLYLLAVLVGFTRVYVGAHYPRDVLAGALLGTVWGIVVSLVDVYLKGRPL